MQNPSRKARSRVSEEGIRGAVMRSTQGLPSAGVLNLTSIVLCFIGRCLRCHLHGGTSMVVIQAPSGATRPHTLPIKLCVWFLQHTLLFAAVAAWHALPASVPTIPGPPPAQCSPSGHKPGAGSATFLCRAHCPCGAPGTPLQSASQCVPICPRLVGCPGTKVLSSFCFHCRAQCLARR